MVGAIGELLLLLLASFLTAESSAAGLPTHRLQSPASLPHCEPLQEAALPSHPAPSTPGRKPAPQRSRQRYDPTRFTHRWPRWQAWVPCMHSSTSGERAQREHGPTPFLCESCPAVQGGPAYLCTSCGPAPGCSHQGRSRRSCPQSCGRCVNTGAWGQRTRSDLRGEEKGVTSPYPRTQEGRHSCASYVPSEPPQHGAR